MVEIYNEEPKFAEKPEVSSNLKSVRITIIFPAQPIFYNLTPDQRRKARKNLNYVFQRRLLRLLWAVQKGTTEVLMSSIEWRKWKKIETRRFQKRNMDVFLRKEHVLVYDKNPSGRKDDKFFFEPAKKTSDGERLQDEYWEIERRSWVTSSFTGSVSNLKRNIQ